MARNPRRLAVVALGLMLLGPATACGADSSAPNLYRASPTAVCLRHDPHYTKYSNYNRKPFSIQVFGPAPRVIVFPRERGATMVGSYYEPPDPDLPDEVGIYFFDTVPHARAVYTRFQAPYVKTYHKPTNGFELRRNAVVVWLPPPGPKAFRTLILGCLRTG